MSFSREPFVIYDIDEGTLPELTDGGFELKYTNPDISVNTSQRYIEHEVIGGMTLRQKVGEEPVQVTVDGVCTDAEARVLDELRFEDTVTISSDRISSLVVQVESTSTQPFTEGGAIDKDREWTHLFSLEFIEAE